MVSFAPRKKGARHNTLTHTEDIEAEAMVDGLVDQLVRHAVEANMTREWDGTCTLSLIQDQIKANHKSLSAMERLCKHLDS